MTATYLRNAWYVAAWAHEVADKPFARRILNEAVVLFRDSGGAARALADRCSHRFAPLHMGKVVGDAIQCAYHGLQFAASGACVHNPHGNGAISSNNRVRAFPLVERHGALWIWMGEPECADPSTIVNIEELTSHERFATAYGYVHARANYQLVADNLLDLTHAQYLHPLLGAGTAGITVVMEMKQVSNTVYSYHSMNSSTVTPFYRMQWQGDCPEIGDGRAHMRWDPPAVLQLDTGMTRVGQATSAGPSTPSMHLLTPETETTTHYFWSISHNSRPDDATLTEAIRQGIEQAFTFEDEPMVAAIQEQMQTTDLMSLKPVLLPGDAAGLRARRVLQALIEAESANAPGGRAAAT